MTTGDSQQNKPEVEQQGRSPEEQSMGASSDANRSDDQEKEDREKRKEAKVGGLFSKHTHHRANFTVSEATTYVCSGPAFSWCHFLTSVLSVLKSKFEGFFFKIYDIF